MSSLWTKLGSGWICKSFLRLVEFGQGNGWGIRGWTLPVAVAETEREQNDKGERRRNSKCLVHKIFVVGGRELIAEQLYGAT